MSADDEELDAPEYEVIEYEFDRKSADELQAELGRWVSEIVAGGPARQELIEAGLDPDTIGALDVSSLGEAISFEEEKAGIAPVIILVVLAPAVNHMAITLWDRAVLPWILNHVASDALGPEKNRGKRKRKPGKPKRS